MGRREHKKKLPITLWICKVNELEVTVTVKVVFATVEIPNRHHQ
jgi:hypothetical protein